MAKDRGCCTLKRLLRPVKAHLDNLITVCIINFSLDSITDSGKDDDFIQL